MMSLKIPPSEEVRSWNVDQVQEFLTQVGLSDCCDIMLKKQVDGLALMGMNDAVLQMWSRDMKIMQIKKLSRLISQLNTIESPLVATPAKKTIKFQAHLKERSQSTASTDEDKPDQGDWGSDFEEPAEVSTARANHAIEKKISLANPSAAQSFIQIRNSSKFEKKSNSKHRISNESENTSFQTFKPEPNSKPRSQEYSFIHHNKNDKVPNLTAPKITSPKPSLSKPKLSKNTESVPKTKTQNQHLDLDEDYEIPDPKYVIPPPSNKQLDPKDGDHKGFLAPADDMQWQHSRLKYLEIVSDDSFRNYNSSSCDDNEYEPIESPPASLLMETVKPLNRSKNADMVKPGNKSNKTSSRIVKNNMNYSIVTTKPDNITSNVTKQNENIKKSGKFSDRCLPPPPAPALESHSIWDPATANVSLISSSNNNSPSSSFQSLTSSTSSQSSISEHLKTFPWYRHCDRRKAEELLLNLNKNGGFLVRDSKHGGVDSPYTLTVLNEGRVFNINIRVKQDGHMALGKEKCDEIIYKSIEEMVEYHKTEELKLTSASLHHPGDSNTTLNCWPT